eukprot:6196690-Pyramimonas_sp.AAC.1
MGIFLFMHQSERPKWEYSYECANVRQVLAGADGATMDLAALTLSNPSDPSNPTPGLRCANKSVPASRRASVAASEAYVGASEASADDLEEAAREAAARERWGSTRTL